MAQHILGLFLLLVWQVTIAQNSVSSPDNNLQVSVSGGSVLTTARKKDSDFYVGGMTNWKSRMVEVDFSFLEDGEYVIVGRAERRPLSFRLYDF